MARTQTSRALSAYAYVIVEFTRIARHNEAMDRRRVCEKSGIEFRSIAVRGVERCKMLVSPQRHIIAPLLAR